MGAFAIARAPGIAAPSATTEIVRVTGNWYHWIPTPLNTIVAMAGLSIPQSDNDNAIAFPLLAPFPGTWDFVQIANRSTAGPLPVQARLALYEADLANGNRPKVDGSGLLAEVLFAGQVVANVGEHSKKAIDIDTVGGEVIWAYLKRNETAPGTANAMAVDAYDGWSGANPGPAFGFGHDVEASPGVSQMALRAPNATFGATAAFGPVPIDPFTGAWTVSGAGVTGLPILRFRLAAL